jgi:hypothetical protein
MINRQAKAAAEAKGEGEHFRARIADIHNKCQFCGKPITQVEPRKCPNHNLGMHGYIRI